MHSAFISRRIVRRPAAGTIAGGVVALCLTLAPASTRGQARRPVAPPAPATSTPVEPRADSTPLRLAALYQRAAQLNPRLEAYFRDNLARVTGGNTAAAVVFYCLSNCWMSWNAAKRAASYGYTQVYWYRDGSDGWMAAHLPTAPGTPAPGWP